MGILIVLILAVIMVVAYLLINEHYNEQERFKLWCINYSEIIKRLKPYPHLYQKRMITALMQSYSADTGDDLFDPNNFMNWLLMEGCIK